MYRCFHCRDLHVSTRQARACSTSDDDWFAEALLEVDRILQRGPVPWTIKKAYRKQPWTMPEYRMLKGIESVLPGTAILPQWWIPGCDYRVDIFIPDAAVAVEIDGGSHQGRTGADRLRSSVLRSHGITIVRIPNEAAMSDTDRIARLIAERVRAEIDPLPLAEIA